MALYQGDIERARHYAEAWVDLARATGDVYALGGALVLAAATVQPTAPDAILRE
jgi:hypothetical protein